MPVLDISMPGGYLGQAGSVLRNETGATLAQGAVAMVDAVNTEAENSTVALGQEGLTAVTTTNMKVNRAAICLEPGGIADHASGRCAIDSGTICQALVDGTTDVAAGDLLKAGNASVNLVKATPGTDRPIARALEARTANSAGLQWVEFYPNGIPAIA